MHSDSCTLGSTSNNIYNQRLEFSNPTEKRRELRFLREIDYLLSILQTALGDMVNGLIPLEFLAFCADPPASLL